MAEKTEALVEACEQATNRIEDAVKGLENQIRSFTGAVERMESLKDDAGKDALMRAMESVVTERTFTRGSLDRLDMMIERARKAVKDLAAKVKSKDFLNHFKTQKSLADAKKALADAENAVKSADKLRSSMEAAITKLEGAAEKESARTTRLVKAENRGDDSGEKEVVEDLEQYATTTIKSAEATLGKVLVVVQQREKLLADVRNELKSKKTWTEVERKARVDEAVQQTKDMERLQRQTQELAGHAGEALRKIDMGQWKNGVTVKRAYALADKACNAFLKLQAAAEARVLDLNVGWVEVTSDLRLLTTSDGQTDLIAEAGKALNTMESFVTVFEMAPQFAMFEGALESATGWAKEVAPWAKTPSTFGAVQKERLGVILKSLSDERMQCDSLWPSLPRTLKQGESVAKRWKGNKQIETLWKRLQVSFKERKKQYDDFVKVATTLENVGKKLLG